MLRTGFGLVIALLVFSTINAYRIQRTLSEEAVQIYHRHVKQDDLLYRLRRALWLGVNSCRDFLLNPFPDREEQYAALLHRLRTESSQFLEELGRLPAPGRDSSDVGALKAEIQRFWNVLERVPAATSGLSAAERYEFVQQEIVPRRNAAGDVIREFAQVTQSALQESEAEFTRTRRTGAEQLLILLGLCLLLGLVVAWVSLARSERLERQTARQYEEVARAKADLQQLSARLMQIQEEERTRLSRELHDEIGQALATLRLEIRRAEKLPAPQLPEIRERLARACELAEKTIQTVRDTSRLLRPALLDDLGLGPALQWLVEDFTRRTGVPCKLMERDLEEVLPDLVRTCVFRVVQEALHNCEKHAAATQASVTIRQSAQLLTVAIEDNGCGFDTGSKGIPRPVTRFGLLGMRERAAALGGVLDVDSSPGNGARLTLRLPIEPAPAVSETFAGLTEKQL